MTDLPDSERARRLNGRKLLQRTSMGDGLEYEVTHEVVAFRSYRDGVVSFTARHGGVRTVRADELTIIR